MLIRLLLFCTLTLSGFAQHRDPIRLTHGPMLGKPTAHSVSVWGRTSDPGDFVVKYGTTADALTQTSPVTTTSIAHDNTGVAELIDLKADTRYHYQIFVLGNPHGLPGSFLTLPSVKGSINAEHHQKLGACTKALSTFPEAWK